MKILILTLKHVPFAPRLQPFLINAKTQAVESYFEDIAFYLPNTGPQAIKITVAGQDVRDFDLVYFRHIERFPYLVAPMAAYLRANKIRVIDECTPELTSGGKLRQMLQLQLAGLPTPNTICYSAELLPNKYQELKSSLGSPFIMKDYGASHGNLNFLIESQEEFIKTTESHPNNFFLCQEFLPNSFDFRMVTIGYQVEVIKKRIRTDSKSHINNTFAGAQVELINKADMSESVSIAEKSARLLGITIAGVDILISDQDHKPYVLEVNKAPDIKGDESLQTIARYFEKSAA